MLTNITNIQFQHMIFEKFVNKPTFSSAMMMLAKVLKNDSIDTSFIFSYIISLRVKEFLVK